MQILCMCPSNIATGGTEGIHNLIHTLNVVGADAKILYVGNKENPQPEEYAKYKCEYLTEFPKNFDGCIIFPEIWANKVIEPEYSKCQVAVFWQGVDVYNWSTPVDKRGLFLKRDNVIHITNLQYGIQYLKSLGIEAVKVADVLNEDFFKEYEECLRSDVVLYNPTKIKMTQFQKVVMTRLTTERGIKFMPLEGYSRQELIDIFRHHKLYIDFGVFSGRERLPREAVMCGCCIITSHTGAASYYEDVAILDKYKCHTEQEAIQTILDTLKNYDMCKEDFKQTQELLIQDRDNYLNEVEALYNEIQRYSSRI